MSPTGALGKLRRAARFCGISGAGIALFSAALLACLISPVAAQAADLSGLAAQLSDRAFAMLTALSSSAGAPNPLLGPVASFAGDAQALSTALGAGRQTDAGQAMAALLRDRTTVDAALAAHPGALKASDWNSLEQQVDKLAQGVKPVSAPVAASAPAGGEHTVGSASSQSADLPRVKIESYTVQGHLTRYRGFFEGDTLKSAGIYQGDQLLKSLKVDHVAGRQRVNFDIQLANVGPGTVLRVYDGAGLSAEASLVSRLSLEGTGGAKEVELGAPSDANISLGSGMASTESETIHRADGSETVRRNVEEIPAHAPAASSRGSSAHSRLGNIQVSVMSATLDDASTRSYDVMGQISGNNVRRAGIYVDGHLAREIELDTGDTFTLQPFDETFAMTGKKATIRVYGPQDRYVETPIRLDTAGLPDALPGAPPVIVATNPNQLAVQISTIQRAASGLLIVSGVLSGKNLASAGLYQNGILVQSLPVSGGLLSSLIPSGVRQVSFSAQFNPAGGPASVRLFDTNGQFTEQPIVIAGNPYAASPSYGVPVSPYGPGVSPYGSGYYGSPYNPGYRPGYGYPPPPPANNSTPWWQKFVR